MFAFTEGFFEEQVLLCLNRTLFPESETEDQLLQAEVVPWRATGKTKF